MTTLTKEQIKANTAAVKRLNRNGCYLFKIKDTDQLFYRPASDEAKKLTVISVAVLKRMFGGYLNVGLMLDVGDKLMVVSKSSRSDAHTSCVQRKVYTIHNKNVTVSDSTENLTFKIVSLHENCLAEKANKEFIHWLLGEANLVLPVVNSSITDIFPTHNDDAGFSIRNSPVYKFESIGNCKVLTLDDVSKGEDSTYNVKSEGLYICVGPDRRSVVLKTIGVAAKEECVKLLEQIKEEWQPSLDRCGYIVCGDASAGDDCYLNIIPRVLF